MSNIYSKGLKYIFSAIASKTNYPYKLSTPKIYGGHDVASSHDFPYIVAIRYDSKLICTGSIIHRQWVLTAANCFTNTKFDYPWDLTVVAGTHVNSNYFGQQYSIEKIAIHPHFDSKKPIHDVALAKIAQHFIFLPFMHPIEIGIPLLNATLVSAGWGGFRLPLSEYVEESPILRFIFMRIVLEDNNVCRFNFYTFCTKRLKKQRLTSTWYSDTGGPLVEVESNRLIGINSCASMDIGHDRVEVFTRVDIYVSWIYSIIRQFD